MKYLLLILTVVMFSSCVNYQRCSRKFPPSESIKVVTETVTKYRDTTIYVYIEADTQYVEKTIYLTAKGWQTELSLIDLPYSKSTAQVVDGILKHEHTQKETELERVISNAIKENSTHTVQVIEKVHDVPYVPGWYKFASWFTIINLLLLFLYILFRFVR